MDIVPRIGRVQRRLLLRLGRRSGDAATSLRFQIVAKLGLGRTSPEVSEALDVARSTVVRTAHRYAEEGVAGLYDKRRYNGRAKVDDAFRRRVAVLLRRTPENFGWRRPTWTRELLCLQLLHLEYLERHPDGYRYTKFCGVYQEWLERRAPTMRQVHVAGDKMFVDYSGKKPHYVEPTTGEVVELELFVAVFGASSYTYAEATRTQTVADFTASTARAFTFFGGVTNAVVPDQLKSAVTSASRYEAGVQRTFAELGRHYGTTILPARPRSPRDKAKVEVAVRASASSGWRSATGTERHALDLVRPRAASSTKNTSHLRTATSSPTSRSTPTRREKIAVLFQESIPIGRGSPAFSGT